MIVAVPMPPPMQSVMSAVLLPVRSSSSSAVPRIMAPVAPSGWPIAIAPPLTLTLFGVEVERLAKAQHDRGESLVDLEQVDVVDRHARARKHLFRHVDWAGQHDRRLRADIGERAHPRPGFQARFFARLARAQEHRGGAVDDAGRIAGVMDMDDALDIRMRLNRHRIEAALLARNDE